MGNSKTVHAETTYLSESECNAACSPVSCNRVQGTTGINVFYCPSSDDDDDVSSGSCNPDLCRTTSCSNGGQAQCVSNQCVCSGGNGDTQEISGDPNALNELTTIIFNILMPASVIIGILLIVKAGYTLMTSQGDPAKTQDGKEQLTSAIMGLLFVLLSIGILRAIVSTLITG